MKKSKIYTKTGDSGETGLVSGNRILKSDPLIDLYGELDELNSRIGFMASLMHEDSSLKNEIILVHRIQSAIFDLGSNFACEIENRSRYKLPQLKFELIQDLEKRIDLLDEKLDPLKNFILPGGSLLASATHLCRTSARNVERKIVHYHQLSKEELPENALVFINRLSDYLFILARYSNKVNKVQEINWIP
jgi:cob(I)alamin adenosyltransferase